MHLGFSKIAFLAALSVVLGAVMSRDKKRSEEGKCADGNFGKIKIVCLVDQISNQGRALFLERRNTYRTVIA